jgi:hypothetical protein
MHASASPSRGLRTPAPEPLARTIAAPQFACEAKAQPELCRSSHPSYPIRAASADSCAAKTRGRQRSRDWTRGNEWHCSREARRHRIGSVNTHGADSLAADRAALSRGTDASPRRAPNVSGGGLRGRRRAPPRGGIAAGAARVGSDLPRRRGGGRGCRIGE